MFRRSAQWMTLQDDRILEYLAADGWATPSLVAGEASVDVSAAHVRERLLFLEFAGLVERIHGETFEISGWGRLYLEGGLDVDHQPRPTVERVHRD